MAGYIYSMVDDDNYEFHVGEEDLGKAIRASNGSRRVIMLQLDGDELEAAIWGLENYNKRSSNA